MRASRHFVVTGGECDPWDLEVRGGFLASARLLCAVEEHGGGCQTVRFRLWPRISLLAAGVAGALAALAWAASRDQAWMAAATLGIAAAGLTGRIVTEAAFAMAALLERVEKH